MLSEANTIYEIRYDFDLGGKTLEMKESFTLKFEEKRKGSAKQHSLFCNERSNAKHYSLTILTYL